MLVLLVAIQDMGIIFRSYEEEREWVEDRRRKRKERKSKWDVLPTPEQAAADAQMTALQNFAATDFSGAAVDSGLPQQTRHARRLYLGNLPHNVTEQELHDFFEHAIHETSPTPITEDPILSVYINQERRFCFLGVSDSGNDYCLFATGRNQCQWQG